MKRQMILLIVVFAVAAMPGIVNALEMSQDFSVANFATDTSFHSTSVAITHTGTGSTDLGFEASGYTTTNQPAGTFGVFGNQFEIKHFSSFSGRVQTEALDPTWGVDFGNVRTGYIRFDSVALTAGGSLSMSIGEFVGGSNTGDDDVVIRVYLNGDAGLGTDIFDTRPGGNGTLEPADAVGGATYVEDGLGGTLTYDFAHTVTSVILYVAILSDDPTDGYYIDDVVIGRDYGAAIISPIDWAYRDVGLLEWWTPGPLDEGDTGTVLVNVYFGVDPNLIVGVYGTTQPVIGLAVDSTTSIPALLDLDTYYYWRVDVIDPNFGNPTPHTGETWSFLTTIPEDVTVTETGVSTEVSEQDRIINRDDFILTLSKDPVDPVSITITEINDTTTKKEELESYNGEAANAPELQITHSGGTAVNSRINSGADDLEQYVNTGVSQGSGSSDLEFFWDEADGGGETQIIGLRFNLVNIPQGATIDSAIVEFERDQASVTGVVYGLITGEDIGNAPALANTTYELRDRLAANPTTTVSFAWTAEGAASSKLMTPDIAPIIQAIVNRGDWAANQSIALFFREDMNPELDDIEFIDPTDPWAPRVGGSTYELNSGNWQTGVTVTIAAIDDDVLETDPELITLTFATSSADAAWTGLTIADLVVSVLENECGAWPLSVYDRNLNCVIDLGDLAMFVAEWQACTTPNDTLGICVDSRP